MYKTDIIIEEIKINHALFRKIKYPIYVKFFLNILDKQKVLKHHPDKRKARGVKVKEGDDDYFTCITRGNVKEVDVW